jgi:hypothetical protein
MRLVVDPLPCVGKNWTPMHPHASTEYVPNESITVLSQYASASVSSFRRVANHRKVSLSR